MKEDRKETGDKEEVAAASISEKTLGMLTFIIYISIGFYCSQNRIPALDALTDFLRTPPTESFLSVGSITELLRMVVAVCLSRVTETVEVVMGYLSSNYSHFQLATVGTIVVHQLVYWSLSLPDFLYQYFPFMRKYKIQQNRACSSELQWDCFKNVMINQWFVEAPIIILNYYFCERMNLGWDVVSFPQWYQVVGAMIGCMAIEDFCHFVLHWIFHAIPVAYQNVHKQHHRFVTPMGMQAEYAHPVEVLVLGVGFSAGCTLFCKHFFVTWLWMFTRLLETIEVHSGYRVPLYGNLLHFLPFYGGSPFHDFHHSNFVGNYGSTFTYWDALFETDLPYRKFQQKNRIRESEALQKQKAG